ncbi:hypothetical protein [Leptolyngbya iicbica]|uniref:Uncharacterized protein n=2 Tax=Cyanophyceae TaxID=3028117 RepID=A0A4V2E2T4_9CYAN|nr:hypothetical protein [Leptolyngbya sp. LK]RZM79666.1 hypothetical protein DYY88_13260 [Leptolyngbya sp. LK]
MSLSQPCADKALTKPSDHIRVLGETGQTVVYLFPDGQAWADREAPDFDAISISQPSSSVAPISPKADEQWLDQLIAAGKVTLAQKAVILHDRESTGLELTEILSARGWL